MLQDILYALRSLTRRPLFSLVAVGLMALGIGLTTAAFGVVDGLLLQSPPYNQPERILVLSGANPGRGLADAALSYPDVVDLQASSRSLEAVAVVRQLRAIVTAGAPTVRTTGARVSPAFFRVFGVQARLGRHLLPADDNSSAERPIVLSERVWQVWYASQSSALGRTIALDGVTYTVVGVMPNWFDYPTGTDFWIPFVPESFASERSSRYVSAVGRLAPSVSVEGARAELRAIAKHLAHAYPASDAGWQLEATPVRESVVGDIRSRLGLAGAGAIIVLLIACANVAGLLLARGAGQHTEVAVRCALGATTARLVRHVLLESLLLSVAGAALGALSAQVASGVLRHAVPGPIPAWVSFTVHARTLGFVTIAAIVSSVLAGIAPAIVAARSWGPELLSGRASPPTRQRQLQQGIVVAQVALAASLLVGAVLLSKSLLRLSGVSPGFDPQGVITAHVMLTGPRYTALAAREQFYVDALTRLRALPGIEAAGASDELPLASGINRFPFTLDGESRPARGNEPIARRALITPGYLPALRISLLRGRDFDAHDDAEHPRVALVSASWVSQFLLGRDAIGRRFQTSDDRSFTIVGVVSDVRHDALDAAGEPTVYTPLAQDPAAEMTLVVRAACDVPGRLACGDTPLAAIVRREVTETDPGITAYAVETMSDVISGSLTGRRAGVILGVALALVALVLSSAGLHGLMALHVARTRRDVGIRLALGARPQDMRRRLIAEGVRLAALGTALGLGIAIMAAHAISKLLYGVAATDAPTLVLVGGVMLALGALATLEPARRAARIAPASALRSE